MVNRILFCSSLCCGGIHLLYLTGGPWMHRVVVLTGVVTSLWNHGTTSPMAKWTDRSVMVVAAILHAYVYHHYFLVGYCSTAYLMAKWVPSKVVSDTVHMSTHFVATFYNLRILAGHDGLS